MPNTVMMNGYPTIIAFSSNCHFRERANAVLLQTVEQHFPAQRNGRSNTSIAQCPRNWEVRITDLTDGSLSPCYLLHLGSLPPEKSVFNTGNYPEDFAISELKIPYKVFSTSDDGIQIRSGNFIVTVAEAYRPERHITASAAHTTIVAQALALKYGEVLDGVKNAYVQYDIGSHEPFYDVFKMIPFPENNAVTMMPIGIPGRAHAS